MGPTCVDAVVQYKTVCSWSLLLLHNTIGGQNVSGMSSIVLVIIILTHFYLKNVDHFFPALLLILLLNTISFHFREKFWYRNSYTTLSIFNVIIDNN